MSGLKILRGRCPGGTCPSPFAAVAVSRRCRIFAAQVHLCELIGDDDDAVSIEGDLLSTSKPTYVAVRMFNGDLSISVRYSSPVASASY